MTNEIIHMSFAKIYKYKNICFDWHRYCGPVFLRKKDLEPKEQQLRPMREYGALGQWLKLSKTEQEKYRI